MLTLLYSVMLNLPIIRVRSIVPVRPAEGRPGTVNYFEVSDCIIHYANLAGLKNGWGAFYFGQIPIEVVFKDNTFYDMPDCKGLFYMNYITEEDGRLDVNFTFENNTVMLSSNNLSAGLIQTGTYCGLASVYNINNNLLLVPDYVDELNPDASTITAPKILTCTGGSVYASNNVIQGYQSW